MMYVNKKSSSEKGKPIVRWGHKVHGSPGTVEDGRTTGEKKEEK